MECRSCRGDPTYHSFEFLSRLPNGDGIFYTCPALGKHISIKEKDIEDYIAHMDSASSSGWIWVFDCSGLQSYQIPSYSVIQIFVNLVQERYRFVLKKVILINMNWKMELILTAARNFMKEETKSRLKIASSKIELVSHGFDTGLSNRLLKN